MGDWEATAARREGGSFRLLRLWEKMGYIVKPKRRGFGFNQNPKLYNYKN